MVPSVSEGLGGVLGVCYHRRMSEQPRRDPTRIFIVLIGLVIGIAALQVARSVILPVVISLFVAMLLMPIIRWQTARRIPLGLAALLSLVLVIAVAGVLLLSLTASLGSFQEKLPAYMENLEGAAGTASELLGDLGIEVNSRALIDGVSPAAATKLVGKGMMSAVSIVSNLLVVFFVTLFMLSESKRFSAKVDSIWGAESAFASSFREIGQKIQRYMLLKTLISGGTGLLVWGFLAIVGVDFALLWGLLTFLLNFLPSVGSILATIPPVAVALLQFDNPLMYGLIVLAGLLTVQMVIGNVLDPKLLGRELNLSPLAVFLAMFFWGWLWGVAGMFLSVPLLVLVKAIALHRESTRPIAIFLEG
jgi:AI-2 transport protein TqsA